MKNSKIVELELKVKDYESKLERITQERDIMRKRAQNAENRLLEVEPASETVETKENRREEEEEKKAVNSRNNEIKMMVPD